MVWVCLKALLGFWFVGTYTETSLYNIYLYHLYPARVAASLFSFSISFDQGDPKTPIVVGLLVGLFISYLIISWFMKLLKEEGPSALFRGTVPNLLKAGPNAAVLFFTYEYMIENLSLLEKNIN